MRLFSKRMVVPMLLGLACQSILVTPAQASYFFVMNSQTLAFLQVVSAPNQCVSYTYDKNGNILLRSNGAFGGGGTWGSSTYGCFTWN